MKNKTTAQSGIEARKIMANTHGYDAIDEKIIHHKDENPFNNSLDNLAIMTRVEHGRLHKSIKRDIKLIAIPIRLPHTLWVALRRLQKKGKIKSIQDACIKGLEEVINDNTAKQKSIIKSQST